jgi:hypothetical protein
VQSGEEELYCRVTLAGALETEDVPAAAIDLILPMLFASGEEMYLAWLGDEPIGGGTLGQQGGICPAPARRGARVCGDWRRERGLELAQREADTVVWFALRLSEREFGGRRFGRKASRLAARPV